MYEVGLSKGSIIEQGMYETGYKQGTKHSRLKRAMRVTLLIAGFVHTILYNRPPCPINRSL